MSDKLYLGVGLRWPEEQEMFDWLIRNGGKWKLMDIIAGAGDIEKVETCGNAGKIYRMEIDWRVNERAHLALKRAARRGQSMSAYAYTALRRAWERDGGLERKTAIARDWTRLLKGVDEEGRRVDEEERRRARERLRARADRGERIDSGLSDEDLLL